MHGIVVALLVVLGLAAANVSYEGYKVYDVLLETEAHIRHFRSLEKISDFDFWSKINKVGKPVSVMVSPRVQKLFGTYLNTSKIEYTLQIENVEDTIKEQKEYHRAKQAQRKIGEISFDSYYRHSEINAYLEQLASDYPDVVTIETIGQSYEKRDMKLIRISSGPRDPAKPIIFVDAGIHAREWIAPATALYLINQLVENPENSNLLDDVDWIVLPSVNPDGYEYTWTDDAEWRKTRSVGEMCDGADANRNFEFHWMEVGADYFECSDVYAGKAPFSEVETQHLRDYILNTENVKAYLTLHSYGEYLLYPWGFDSSLPSNWEVLDDLGQKVRDAIKAVNGTDYTVGSSTRVLYAASGASDDWAKGVAGVDIVYTIELPGGGTNGFNMPASGIRGVVVETFEGFKVIADFIATNY